MSKAVLSALLVFVAGTSVAAQDQEGEAVKERIVEILNADSARAMTIEGRLADMLVGNVALKQGETLLGANRAVRFKESDQIIFEGSVTIIDEGDSLFADRVVYQSDEKTGVGTGDVRWSDGEVAITATLARYFVADKVAEFEGDVVMQDSTTTVLSRYGTYDVENRLASFHEDVFLEQRRLSLTAEALTHDRESGLTTAVGSVWIFRLPDPDSDESASRVLLVADTASSERDSGVNRLSGDAGLVRIETGSARNDTLIVRSSSIDVAFADSTETFTARHNARLWRGSLAGSADSFEYTSASDSVGRSSTMRMLGDPFVWRTDTQVSGDTLDIHAQEGEVTLLEAYENAFVGFQDSTRDFIQQMKGRRLEAVFAADTLRNLVLRPNAEAIYFAVDSTTDNKETALRFTSTQIMLRFVGNTIDRIIASDDVEGDLKELARETTLPSLKGFRWRASNRPMREDLLDETITRALRRFESY